MYHTSMNELRSEAPSWQPDHNNFDPPAAKPYEHELAKIRGPPWQPDLKNLRSAGGASKIALDLKLRSGCTTTSIYDFYMIIKMAIILT